MPRRNPTTPRAVVERCFELLTRREFGEMLELVSETVVVATSTGQVYVGREGYVQMLTEHVSPYENHAFEIDEIRELGEGFVLVRATITRTRANGTPDAIPGVWLVNVEAGLLNSWHYFRTADEALDALPMLR